MPEEYVILLDTGVMSLGVYCDLYDTTEEFMIKWGMPKGMVMTLEDWKQLPHIQALRDEDDDDY